MKANQQSSLSKQDYGTPRNFLQAVLQKLRITDFSWDLAATDDNAITDNGWYTLEQDSLKQDWYKIRGCLWLNPPFEDIEPWVKKAHEESILGAHIVVLVPLSIAKWWKDHVDGKAYVYMLHGRLTFVGETKPYPKDCALLLYGPEGYKGYEVWNWR